MPGLPCHSGFIDFKEFSQLHNQIRSRAKEQASKLARPHFPPLPAEPAPPAPSAPTQALGEAEAKRKQEQAELRTKMLKVAVVLLVSVLVFMLVGNAGLTTAVVFLSKDTAVDSSGAALALGCESSVTPANAVYPPCLPFAVRTRLSTPPSRSRPISRMTLRTWPFASASVFSSHPAAHPVPHPSHSLKTPLWRTPLLSTRPTPWV